MNYNPVVAIAFCLAILWGFTACEDNSGADRNVLVFSKTEGFRHSSIEPGIAAIKKLGKENDFNVFTSEDTEVISEAFLENISAVIFLNTTGDIFSPQEQAIFERYIQAGGGFVGVHSAADTEYDWVWYGSLVGGYFQSHPATQPAKINVTDPTHPSTEMLPNTWERTDEWYNYKNIQSNLNVVLTVDESSYEGGTNGEHHPIAWYHEFDGGRAFYTGLGHTEESFLEELFLQHLLGGIEYAIGDNKRDYASATTYPLPEENRFVQTVLATSLYEPMELDILPDGRILIVERRGRIKMYVPRQERMVTITKMNVHTEFEDGLLGLAIDPNYEENHWIYLFYSPVGERPVQHVSRFVFQDDSLHYASEKVVLEIDVQRESCCHSGGSLEFDNNGHLFIGVGDNTNPFASSGYAPIDERPGRQPLGCAGLIWQY